MFVVFEWNEARNCDLIDFTEVYACMDNKNSVDLFDTMS